MNTHGHQFTHGIGVCIYSGVYSDNDEKIEKSKKHSSRMSTIHFIILHRLCPDQGVYGQGVGGHGYVFVQGNVWTNK